MNWWYQSACQRRMMRSGTMLGATARSKISAFALMVPQPISRSAPCAPRQSTVSPVRARAASGANGSIIATTRSCGPVGVDAE
jgi:hypothetical protein